jgi:hypothetical protein
VTGPAGTQADGVATHVHSVAPHADMLAALALALTHELNNPLVFVLGNLDHVRGELQAASTWLRDGTAPPDAQDRLGDAVTALTDALEGAHRLSRMARELEALGRSQAHPADRVHPKRQALLWLRLLRPYLRSRVDLMGAGGPLPTGAPEPDGGPAIRGSVARLSHLVLHALWSLVGPLPERAPPHPQLHVSTQLHPNGTFELGLDLVGGPGAPWPVWSADRMAPLEATCAAFPCVLRVPTSSRPGVGLVFPSAWR